MSSTRSWFSPGAATVLFLPALLLFLGAAAWKHWGVPPARVAGNLRTFRITEGTAADVSPSFSPDGSRVVYASNRSGKYRIHIRTVEPGSVTAFSGHEMENDPEPAWSPDGKSLAFAAGDGISVIPTAGETRPRRITEQGAEPWWSPDGRSLVFRSESNLMIVPSSGGPAVSLTTPNQPEGRHESPCWSNDGKHVLFLARTDAGDTIWSVNVTDRSLHQIALPRGRYDSAVYSHDSKGIFYSEQTGDGRSHIKLVLLDGLLNPMEIKVAGATVQRSLRLSRDGRRLAYVLEPPAAVAGIYVVDLK